MIAVPATVAPARRLPSFTKTLHHCHRRSIDTNPYLPVHRIRSLECSTTDMAVRKEEFNPGLTIIVLFSSVSSISASVSVPRRERSLGSLHILLKV
jgi:hypothetical protein